MLLRYGSDGKYTIELFQLKHVDQTVQMLYNSFIKLNPFWKAYKPSLAQMYSVIRMQLLPCIKNSISFVHIHKLIIKVLLNKAGQVIGASITQDLWEYQQIANMKLDIQTNDPFQKQLTQFNLVLDAPARTRDCLRGEMCYGYYGVIDPSFTDAGVSTWFWHANFFLGREAGQTLYHCRVTNPVSLAILIKMGAKVINEMTITDKEHGLESFTAYLIELDLVNKFKVMSAKL